ncbi:MAG: 23S ribosomal RNA methyltransferase Erm [Clostridia bacterium]|nr:23S ribosomal RNA methyltransferase Erm [Clostridia bacterium]
MPKSAYSISQNFLTSRRTIARLLALTDLSPADTVLEIGTGKGHITRALAERCQQVLTYEIDPFLAQRLHGSLPDNVRLFQRDFLTAPLPRKPYKVFANIPFNHTTAIIRHLTTSSCPPDAIWLIMEKGAALRFSGTSRESAASLLLKPWWDVHIRYHLQRQDFHPAPSVDCVLMELRRKPAPDLSPRERTSWQRFTTQALQHGLRGMLTSRQINAALREANIPMSATLKYVQWLCLFRWWRHS